MTFSTTYAYSENYVLVLSHDEVVHLKCSMINKMPGLGQDKFENFKSRISYTYLIILGKEIIIYGTRFWTVSGMERSQRIGLVFVRRREP